MKKTTTILFFFLFLFHALYAQIKNVAIIEPSGTVSPIQKAIVTAKIAEALTNTEKYDTFTGADLICVTQFFENESQFFVRSSLIDNESGGRQASR